MKWSKIEWANKEITEYGDIMEIFKQWRQNDEKIQPGQIMHKFQQLQSGQSLTKYGDASAEISEIDLEI